MNMFNFKRTIHLSEELSTSTLSARATARRIFKSINKYWFINVIELDFREIQFCSRSFMDELNHLINESQYEIYKTNMNQSVKKMNEKVQQASQLSREKLHVNTFETNEVKR